jgi:hypothetical protein
MHNSFSLGLIEGVLYGLTPFTPWFVGLAVYVLRGHVKGVLVFGSIFIGQILLVLLTFFGGPELLWLWYYMTPVLLPLGFCITLAALFQCFQAWAPPRRRPVAQRKEGVLYLALGGILGLGSPDGASVGGSILLLFPSNTSSYVCGFLLTYTLLIVAMLALICLSPLGHRIFGQWSWARTRANQEIISARTPKMSIWVLRLTGLISAFLLAAQFQGAVPDVVLGFYPDFLLGGIPGIKYFTPMPDFEWTDADPDEEVKPGAKKTQKLQSVPEMNHNNIGEDTVMDIKEENPFAMEWLYHETNESREREKMPVSLQDRELQDIATKEYKNGVTEWLNARASAKLVRDEVNRTGKYAQNIQSSNWLEPDANEGMPSRWLNRLMSVRIQMDAFHVSHAPVGTPPRPFFPLDTTFDRDYDWDPVAIAKDGDEVTEEDVLQLEDLRAIISPTLKPMQELRPFWKEDFDMTHRGGEIDDFGVVVLQDLPKEIHLPWDYPLVHAPNRPDIGAAVYAGGGSGGDPEAGDFVALPRYVLREEDKPVIAAKNEVQNKNVWFLDPIALGFGFFANDPAPVDAAFNVPTTTNGPESEWVASNDPKWTAYPVRKEKKPWTRTYGGATDPAELRAANTTRRWCRGVEGNKPVDGQVPQHTPRDTIFGPQK